MYYGSGTVRGALAKGMSCFATAKPAVSVLLDALSPVGLNMRDTRRLSFFGFCFCRRSCFHVVRYHAHDFDVNTVPWRYVVSAEQRFSQPGCYAARYSVHTYLLGKEGTRVLATTVPDVSPCLANCLSSTFSAELPLLGCLASVGHC